MPRAIWRGAISFGMVNIPVRLFTATESRDVRFKQLLGEDKTPVKQLRWSPTQDREVAYDELVRGYEYAKEQYVIIEAEDFEKLPVPSLHTVELTAFVSAGEIDPIYYEKTYYLEPDEAGVKPFALLVRALEEKGLVALGKLAIRQKEHLCALRPYEGVMALQTLYYPDEIRGSGDTDLSGVEVSEQELEMAYALIDMLEKPFEPAEYSDQYREQLMAMIQAKLEGGEVVAAEATAPAPAPVDLMAALRASVEATKQRQAGGSSNGGASKGAKKRPAKAGAKQKRTRAAS